MANINLRDGELARMEITKAQEDEISKLYHQVYLNYKKQMDALPLKGEGTVSQSIKKTYLNKLTKQLKDAYQSLGEGLEKQIQKGMESTASAVVQSNADWLSKAGLKVEGAYSYVPRDIVSLLSSGKLYGEGWSLSKAIWGDSQKKAHDIDQVVATGVAANKSAYEIAKDLEKYVNPDAKKEWDWSKVYPGTSKKVDYNAQRLARTMVSHAYQQSLLATTKYNPFVTGYRWRSAHTHRTCELCNERDGQVYSANDLPLDHPNGMCTFIAVIEDSMTDIADRIADWYRGYSDEQLDDYVSTFSMPQVTKESRKPAVTSLVPGKYSAEITDSVSDYFLPQSTRSKLGEIQKLNSFDDFSKYFETIGITLDTDLKRLSDERRFDTVKPVKELCEKLAVGIDSYKQLYGDNALSKLNRILLYSDSLECTAAYNFNRIGENDPMAGTLEFRDWTANGRDVFHELAHAFQDSNARPGEDAVSFSQRVVQQAGLNPNFNAYSGAAQDVIEAERFADAFGFGFYLGSESGLEFIQSVQREFLKGDL